MTPGPQLSVTVGEAQERVEELIDLVLAGGAVTIVDAEIPPIQLVALDGAQSGV